MSSLPLPRRRDELVAARRDRDVTITAIIPARNEETTVGTVVEELVELVDDDLLCEVVVVDGSSTDQTVDRARAAGARVLLQQPRPEGLPAGGGKGDAMWQGLATTDADLVLFVDADVRGFTADFVVPLLGPLLAERDVQLVKAAYDRPLTTSGEQHGGGRVTELLARPVLTLLWPELAFLAQPLAGEYAARRTLLEQVPFVQGYGVELALLIDTLERHGPDAIAQVDLGVRHHGHQSLAALGRMATEILAVALARADAQDRRPVTDPVLHQMVRRPGGRIDRDPHPVTVRQRPPLAG